MTPQTSETLRALSTLGENERKRTKLMEELSAVDAEIAASRAHIMALCGPGITPENLVKNLTAVDLFTTLCNVAPGKALPALSVEAHRRITKNLSEIFGIPVTVQLNRNGIQYETIVRFDTPITISDEQQKFLPNATELGGRKYIHMVAEPVSGFAMMLQFGFVSDEGEKRKKTIIERLFAA